jgi:hypothetical protein
VLSHDADSVTKNETFVNSFALFKSNEPKMRHNRCTGKNRAEDASITADKGLKMQSKQSDANMPKPSLRQANYAYQAATIAAVLLLLLTAAL